MPGCSDKPAAVASRNYLGDSGVLSMIWAPRQVQVLRLLRAHRFMDVAQMHQVVFAPVSRRACQRCLTTLFTQGLVERARPAAGGLGGGSRGYVYGLSAKGAEVLAHIDDAPRAQIPYVRDPEAFTLQRARHQLAVNRCFIALWQALEAAAGYRLVRWNSDPHLRMRYGSNGRMHVIHPDGLAQVRSPAGDHWLFFEIDRGTEELRRIKRKVHRYVRFWRSGAWRSEFPVFPELRITSSRRTRVESLCQAVETGLQDVTDGGIYGANDVLRIAVAWEPAFLADPLGAVWTPVFGDGVELLTVLREPPAPRIERKGADLR